MDMQNAIKDFLIRSSIVCCHYLVILDYNWTYLTICALFTYIWLMFRLHACYMLCTPINTFVVVHFKYWGIQSVVMNIFGCLSSHRWFLTSIQFVWVYGRAWQWQMQQWTCSDGFIKCFTTTFINPQSTHSQPPFYTFTLNKVDEDNWWWRGWFEREAIWQRN